LTSISRVFAIWNGAIAGLPPEYRHIDPPDFDGDMKDWPRIAKLQSDLLVQAFATHQTRVASYMLTKCQSIRVPWLGTRPHGTTITRMRKERRRARWRGKGSACSAISAVACGRVLRI